MPSVAYFNTSTTVMFKKGSFRHIAASHHAIPASISFCFRFMIILIFLTLTLSKIYLPALYDNSRNCLCAL